MVSENRRKENEKTLSFALIGLIPISIFAVFPSQVVAEDLGSWVTKANLLQTRKDTAAVTFDCKIYAVGGSDRSGGGTERPTTIVEI